MLDVNLIPLKPDFRLSMNFRANVEVNDFIVYKCGSAQQWDGWNDFESVPCVEGVCTACQERSYFEKVKREGCRGGEHIGFVDEYDGCRVERFTGDWMICPCCGKRVRAIHVSEFGSSKTLCRQSGVFGCMRRVDGIPVLITYSASREFDKEGNTSWDMHGWEAYWVEEIISKRGMVAKRLRKATGYNKYMGGIGQREKWLKAKRCTTTLGSIMDWMEPFGYEMTDGTILEKSGLADYAARDWHYMDRYLDTWCHHPTVENVCKAYPWMCYMIMRESEAAYQSYYYNVRLEGSHDGADFVDWKKVRPHEMLKMDKADARRMEDQRRTGEWIRLWMDIRDKTGEKVPDEVMERFLGKKRDFIPLFCESLIGRGVPLSKSLRYIDSRGEADKAKVAVMLCDTWDLLESRGAVLDSSSMWPKDLKRTHDREVALKTQRLQAEAAGKRTERDVKIGKNAEKLMRFSWVCGELMIEPARSGKEMIAEGNHNHNCVATYQDKVADGKTTIWFIRRLSEPSVPYYTLELDPRDMSTVIQNRGSNNCDRTPEVAEFERMWLEHVNQLQNMKEVRANA